MTTASFSANESFHSIVTLCDTVYTVQYILHSPALLEYFLK